MAVRYQRAVDLVELTGILQTTVTGLSIDEIAVRFEVSRRTAERMLSALRDRLPDLEPVHRSGRKYWKLPSDGRARPLRLPRALAALASRVEQLEAQIHQNRAAQEHLQALTEGVLGTSRVGIFVLDADFKVVWLNAALETYLGVTTEDAVGRDKRALIRESISNLFECPDEFVRRVFATYEDNTYIENFECHIVADPTSGRRERWLEHWSRPISTGLYAGGRVEHYVDVTDRMTTTARSSLL